MLHPTVFTPAMNAVGNHYSFTAQTPATVFTAAMNAVDNHYSFTALVPDNPFIGVLASDHGDRIASNIPTRKRPRESPVSFFPDDISSPLLQQGQDVDHLILYHASKVRAELLARRRSIFCQTLTAVEEGASKRLRAKDDEIQRIGKLNRALEEQVRLLCLDCQVWRELAKTNKAAAVGLRSDLEDALADQVRGMTEDAESCCGGDEEQNRGDTAGNRSTSVCSNCKEGEASVLLLPCRHLCLCGACGSAINVCPVRRCSKVASINVNIS